MKPILLFSFLLFTVHASAQLSFPKGFHRIDGSNATGDLDVYSNGKYAFETHKLFRDYDFKKNDTGVKKKASEFFGFPFYLTKDSLCWGTGKYRTTYSYVIVTWDGEVIELSGEHNDSGFSQYSKWLLATVRKYHKQGKLIMFP